MTKLLESCQLFTSFFTKSSKKNPIKRRVVRSAFVLSFVFLQNNSVVLRVNSFDGKANSPTNVSHVCISCIFPTLVGINVFTKLVLCLSLKWWIQLTDLYVPSLFCPLIDVLQHSRFKWWVHRTAAIVEGKESAEQT